MSAVIIGSLSAVLLRALAPIVAHLGSDILAIVIALIKNGAAEGTEAALRVAKVVVTEIEKAPPADGSSKAKAAFAAITAELLRDGKQVAASEINLAIELAVAALKKDLLGVTPATLEAHVAAPGA